jgi:CYTH domain-containing protein
MQRLLTEISLFLGEPEPYEIERKYLIKYPSIKSLENDANCTKVEIIQTYLKSEDGVEMRVRQRGQNGSYLYTKTTKKQLSPVKRIEYEERISQDEYLNLLMNADTSCKQIRKTRYCLVYKNQYFEIDIYPFWKDQAIMEIELQTEDQEISFPPQIEIVKEVTNDKNYSNYALSKI